MNKRRKVSAILLALVFIFSVVLSGCTSSTKFLSNGPDSAKSQPSGTTGESTKGSTVGGASTNTGESTTSESSSVNAGGNGDPSVAEGSNTSSGSGKPAVKVKGLYLTGWTVGSMAKVNHYIELAKNTEINSYVVDIKDDDGYVGYESQVPEVRQLGAWTKKYDVDKVLKAFHDNNIHVIGRLVCFKDPIASKKEPDWAVKNAAGGLWKDYHGMSWINPYNKASWAYLVSIAKEAVAKGFDEIQFDYMRFPSDGSKKNMNFGTVDKKKYEMIDEFLAYAKKEMPGIKISADVFGIICESPEDTEGIGQYLEYVGKDVDYISPMVYPSHYAAGQIVNKVKFAKPDLDPYHVVYNTLVKAKNRIAAAGEYKAEVRPYIQDFTASWLGKGYYQSYGPQQVREQIQAVYDAGYDEWILWDANNTYSESAMQKQ